jgi:predicted MFS family arabinose efflux permease
MVLNMATRMTYPFLSAFASGLNVDLKALSRVMAIRSGTGIFSPFLASLADLWGHKRGILIGIGLCFISNLAIVIVPTYWVFLFSVSLCYLGMYFFMSSMQAYVGEVVPFERRGMALAVTEMGWGFSFVIGMPIIGLLIKNFGWLSPFWLLIVLTAISAGVLAWLLPQNQAHLRNPAENKSKAFFQNLGHVFSSSAARSALVMSLSLVAANEMVNLVFGVWIEDSFNLPISGLGLAAFAIGVVEVFGELTGGLSADRIGKSRTFLIGVLVNIVSAAWMAFFAQTLVSAIAGLMVFYLSFEFAIVSAFGLISEVLPSARATMMGANVAALSLGRMVGAFFVPYLYELGFGWNLAIAVLINLISIGAMVRTRQKSRFLSAIADAAQSS